MRLSLSQVIREAEEMLAQRERHSTHGSQIPMPVREFLQSIGFANGGPGEPAKEQIFPTIPDDFRCWRYHNGPMPTSIDGIGHWLSHLKWKEMA